MTISQFVAMAVGAFYLFGGAFVIRALTFDDFLDKAIAAIELKPRTIDRSIWAGGAIGVLTGASGAALALLSAWALPLFCACLAVQMLFITIGTRQANGDSDDSGRIRSRNAAAIYAIATAFVLWLWNGGLLNNWDHPVGLVVLAVALGLWGWLIGGLRNGPKSTTVRSEDTDPSPNDYLTGEAPERVLLDQRKGGAPLYDAATGVDIDHFELFSDNLAERIERWDATYRRWFNAKLDEEEYADTVRAIREDGEAIAARLVALLGDGNVEGPYYDDDFAAAEEQLARK